LWYAAFKIAMLTLRLIFGERVPDSS